MRKVFCTIFFIVSLTVSNAQANEHNVVYEVSTEKKLDKQFQTIQEMKVYAYVLYINDYKPALIKAVNDEAEKLCIDGNIKHITNEFSSISSTTFHSDEAEIHFIKVIGDITCQ